MSKLAKRNVNQKTRKRIKVTSTTRQYDIMVKFMVQNPTFATYRMGRSARDKVKYNNLWQTLSLQLNMEGPPIRNRLQWKKVWVDYKYYIKKKYTTIQRVIEDKSGNNVEVRFTDNELAIKKLIFDALKNRSKLSKRKSQKANTVCNNTSPTRLTTNIEEEIPIIKTEVTDTFIDVNDATDNTMCHTSSTTSTTNIKEISIIKTEVTDTFIDVNDATDLLSDSISPPTGSIIFDMPPADSQGRNQLSLLEEQAEIEKKLEKIKKEKLKILRQTADIKERLHEKLQELKKRKFELKCEQFKYKAQKLELKKKMMLLKEVSNL